MTALTPSSKFGRIQQPTDLQIPKSSVLENLGIGAKQGFEETTIAYAKDYMHVIFFGSILFFLQLTINASLVSRGDTKSLRNVHIFSFFLNIVLNPIFIYGFYFIPSI